MTKDLFKDFDPVSAKAWKQKIQVDLKGADYNDTLIYKSHHGIDVKPFYHREDTKLVSVKAVSSWDVCEKIYIENVEKSITRANNVLTRGAEMLWFVIPNDSVNVKAILDKLNLGDKFIYIECTFLSEAFIKTLKDLQQSYNLKIGVDIIGHLAKDGNWFTNKDEDHSVLNKCIGKDILSIDAALYQNAGANIPQELAYTLAHINEYANHFTDQKDLNFTVKVSIGSNYFFEIAKLRALRLLFSTLAKEYNLNDNLFILAHPTKRNKAIYDYNVNMLRTTTECMSAALGGANAIYNMPYDALFHKNNEFGDRISRNQLLVLKHESYFDMVDNAADGSYYIESLTQQFAEKALEIFKQIEMGGGFVQQLFDGKIQQKIKDSASQEQQLFKDGKLSLIGTNKHPNKQDAMANDLQLYPFVKQNPRKTLIEPIIEKRLAEQLEQERLKNEAK